MPWYYAGPEAKPVGPVSLEELHACRARGTVKSETYVIEQTGQPVESLAWKRYSDVFPLGAGLPPIPPLPPLPLANPPPPPQPQLLPPSATPDATGRPAFPPDARPDPYYHVKPTNGWCGWGFGFGLAALILSFACGIGLFPALLAIPICIIGLVRVQRHREQAGRGLAIAGLILSGIAVLIALTMIISLAIPMMKAHGLTVTEETSNDSN